MGYRSDVTIVLTRDALSKLYGEIPDAMSRVTAYADNFLHKNDSFLLYWSNVKWYEEHGEIGALMRHLTNLEDNDYYYLRIGEDREDVEENGGHWDNPFDTYLVRKINMDLEGSKEVDLSVFH